MYVKISLLLLLLLFKIDGISYDMTKDLEKQITHDLSRRMELGYNHQPIACLITPEKTSYLLTNPKSSIHDLYEIGSISKFFTAHLCLILHKNHLIDIHKPIGSLIRKNFPNAHSSFWDKTLYHLLTHTSGLMDPNEPTYNKHTKNTVAIVEYNMQKLDSFLSKQCLPNELTTPVYSNLGYILIGMILEKATGKSYEDLLKTYILHPLKMYETFIGMPKASLQHQVIGHSQGITTPYWKIDHVPAFAGIVSSLHDLTLYFKYVFQTAFEKDPILNELIKTPFKIQNFAVNTGLGWSCDERFDGKVYVLTGKTLGFSSFVGWDIEQKRLIIFLSDNDTLGNMPYRWFNTKFPKDQLYKVIPIEPSEIKTLEGTYQFIQDKDLLFTITANENYISLHSENEMPTILYPTKKGYFFSKQLDTIPSLFLFRKEKNKLYLCEHSEGSYTKMAKKIR